VCCERYELQPAKGYTDADYGRKKFVFGGRYLCLMVETGELTVGMLSITGHA